MYIRICISYQLRISDRPDTAASSSSIQSPAQKLCLLLWLCLQVFFAAQIQLLFEQATMMCSSSSCRVVATTMRSQTNAPSSASAVSAN